jgi:hypothetical protein
LCHVVRNTRWQKRFDIFPKRPIPELAVHVFFEFRTRDGKTIVFQAALEAINGLGVVHRKRSQGKPKVREIASLLSLMKGAQFGSQLFLDPVDADLRLA